MPSVLDALAACGRERVIDRRGGERPAVAIRWWHDDPGIPRGEKWIHAEADTFDVAACSAARQFADALEERATRLRDWARRIRAAIPAQVLPRDRGNSEPLAESGSAGVPRTHR